MVQCFTVTGCDQIVSFEDAVLTVMNANDVEPWEVKWLIRDRLQAQLELAKRSPLRDVEIEEGLLHFGDSVGTWFRHLSRDRFVNIAEELFRNRMYRVADVLAKCEPPRAVVAAEDAARDFSLAPQDRDELYNVFDSMDYDGNLEIGIGEWAGGLTIFFQGTPEQAVHAVFKVLDTDGNGVLTKRELQEYAKPLLKAMTPVEADSLRPLLLKKITDDVFDEMDIDHDTCITSEELLDWTNRGNNLIDRLAYLLHSRVFNVWLENKGPQRAGKSPMTACRTAEGRVASMAPL